MEILCFYAGVAFVYTKSLYPVLFVAIALFLKASRRIVIWFIVATVWAYGHQHWIADKGMPATSIIGRAELIGTVSTIPTNTPFKTQFQFFVHRLNNQPVKARVLLSCYKDCPSFKTGQTWQLYAKLKRPENLGNPGSFDFRQLLQSRHIHWTGYLARGKALLLAEPTRKMAVLLLREHLAATLKRRGLDDNALGIVQALTLGITNQITPSQWDLFRHTGTTHLMVISGAHIGLVSGLVYWVLRWLWSRSARLCLFRPAAQMAGIGGLLTAIAYSLLAGFAIPAQRALIACLSVLLGHCLSQRFTAWQSWRYALLVVLLFEPHAVLLPGFYLSFLAVATLIASSQRLPYRGFKKIMCLQAACLLGLMPFSLYWFSYGAVNGFIANLLAIPLVGYVLVPLALLYLFLIQFSGAPGLIPLLNLTIKSLLLFLGWIDHFAMINLQFSLTTLISLFALMLTMMLWFFLPIRSLLPAQFVLVVAALFPYSLHVKRGEARIDVLDVGQGLAIVVNTAEHTLIYDTGMKFYQGGDMAEMAIIPYLLRAGIKKIDKVVISHPDLDHRGGLMSLEAKYPIGELLVDNVPFYHRGKNCHQYPGWEWDGVSFRFFPIKQTFRDKNNSSCVLQITTPGGKVLLPGDIELAAENYLVATFSEQLASDTLIVAHHGSKTSSTPSFIHSVAPHYAIISAGFDNRYHFPHQQTLTTLAANQIKLFNTMDCGMVSLILPADQKISEPLCYHLIKRPWLSDHNLLSN